MAFIIFVCNLTKYIEIQNMAPVESLTKVHLFSLGSETPVSKGVKIIEIEAFMTQ